MKQTVEEFLNRHNLNADEISMQDLCDKLMKQMRDGLEGKPGSLPMIPSFCSPDARPKAGEKVIVIDAGGTNFRTCIVTFDDELKPVISDFRKSRMPGIDHEVSSQEFFSIIADETERLIDQSDRIGFCFSYAADILPDHDGVPTLFSKEVKAPEVVGKHLGKELLAEFARRGHDVRNKKVLILNDTVSTLLAAQAQNAKGNYDGVVGFILGTGTNTAYIEKTSNITKLEKGIFADPNQIINVESGEMVPELGDIDRRFLESTDKPKVHIFEKMISGAYLGPLSYMVIETAVNEGLFSDAFAKAFSEVKGLSTIELNDFLHESEDCALAKCAKDEDDYDTLFEILGYFISRAAKYTAANLAAAVLVTDYGKDEDHPVLINADGTTFHKTAFMKMYVTDYLDSFLAENGRRAVITQIDDSPVIGSAIGALTL